MIEADGLGKRYDTDGKPVIAIESVSFTVAEGEFAVVVGPSGCGKTTLLRLFAGLTEPTEGVARVDDAPVEGPSMDRAVVFQEFNLFPWRTVAGNVGFGLEMAGVPERERSATVREYVDLVGLSGNDDRYPDELSGGMRQRVGLARALAVDPSVLLMDEPFGALDAQTKQLLQRELLQLREREPKTVFFVTHDIDEALRLADRVFVMGSDPNRIESVLDVPFDRPRYDREIETDSRFGDLKGEIWELLRENQPDAAAGSVGGVPSPGRNRGRSDTGDSNGGAGPCR